MLGRLVPQWARPDSTSGAESLVVLAEALLRLLNVVGAGRGCLVVLEDLHDADVPSILLAEEVARRAVALPLVLLVTVRTGEPLGAAADTALVALRSRATVVALGGLPPDAVVELVRESGLSPDTDLVRVLIERTRAQVERNHDRSRGERALRRLLFETLPHPRRLRRLAPALSAARRLGLTRLPGRLSALTRIAPRTW